MVVGGNLEARRKAEMLLGGKLDGARMSKAQKDDVVGDIGNITRALITIIN